MSVSSLKTSFRQLVRMYIKDHPMILTKRGKGSMDELYEAFPGIDKPLLTVYKAEYINELEFARFEASQSISKGVTSSPGQSKKKSQGTYRLEGCC